MDQIALSNTFHTRKLDKSLWHLHK